MLHNIMLITNGNYELKKSQQTVQLLIKLIIQ